MGPFLFYLIETHTSLPTFACKSDYHAWFSNKTLFFTNYTQYTSLACLTFLPASYYRVTP